MLNTISWQGYWTCITLATIAYYLFLRFVYFRGSLLHGLRRQKEVTATTSTHSEPQDDNFPEVIPISHLSQSEQRSWDACMNEINAFFEAQKKSKAVKGEIVFALHQILQRYPSLRDSDNYEVISKAIKVQCENLSSISLSEEELKGVWFG